MDQRSNSRESYARALPCAVLIARPDGAADAARALEIVGLRVGSPVPPREAARRLSTQCLLDVLAVEAWSMDEAELEELLPPVAAIAGERKTQVVVALRPEQIELVGGTLIATPAALLCEPTVAERVTALVTVRPAADGPLHDNDRKGDPAEFARLSDEVERIARTLARLTGQDGARADHPRPGPEFTLPPAAAVAVEAASVRAAIRIRRLREQFVDRDMLGEPGWDILLDLFRAELEQQRVSVSSLCIAAAVPPTTALRWITGMTEAGMLQRHADTRDRRRAFVSLAEGASVAMRNYFAALQRQGLPFG